MSNPRTVIDTAGGGGDVDMAVSAKRLKKPRWQGDVLTPGKAMTITCEVKGKLAGLPSVKLEVFALVGKDPGGDAIHSEEVTGTAEGLVELEWTPDANRADGYPDAVVVVATSGSARPKTSRPLRVAKAWVKEAVWLPGTAYLGDEVQAKFRVHGLEQGASVTFKVSRLVGRGPKHMEDLTAELDEELTAVAPFTLPTPDKIREEDEENADEGDDAAPVEDEALDDPDMPPEAAAPNKLKPPGHTFVFVATAEELTGRSDLHATEKPFFFSL